MAKVGRPTDFREEYIEQVYKLALLGLTDKEMADIFNTTEQTFNNWKKDFPEFFESLKKGKDLADAKVASRLFERAMGYEHDSEEIKVLSSESGSYIERVPVRKIYPPDPTSAIFWLKNRQPRIWRDKQEVDNKHDGEIVITRRVINGKD